MFLICACAILSDYDIALVDLYSTGTPKQQIKPVNRLLLTCREMWSIIFSYENQCTQSWRSFFLLTLWVYYTIPFGFSLFWHFRVNIFISNHFVWRRITDEGPLSEMRIWSILLIKSDLKWCIHLSRISFYITIVITRGMACRPSIKHK